MIYITSIVHIVIIRFFGQKSWNSILSDCITWLLAYCTGLSGFSTSDKIFMWFTKWFSEFGCSYAGFVIVWKLPVTQNIIRLLPEWKKKEIPMLLREYKISALKISTHIFFTQACSVIHGIVVKHQSIIQTSHGHKSWPTQKTSLGKIFE